MIVSFCFAEASLTHASPFLAQQPAFPNTRPRARSRLSKKGARSCSIEPRTNGRRVGVREAIGARCGQAAAPRTPSLLSRAGMSGVLRPFGHCGHVLVKYISPEAVLSPSRCHADPSLRFYLGLVAGIWSPRARWNNAPPELIGTVRASSLRRGSCVVVCEEML